jgi:glutathione-specific gamma-glutamylcyclotransferase
VFEVWPGDGKDAWVFGYGSLMWDPCFPYVEARRALLRGYHRALCILSILNRGTVDRPGLALGLDRGGSCRGFAFRIDAPDLAAAKADLWRREMANAVYVPKMLPVEIAGGGRVPALVFVARRGHPQYVGDLQPEQAAALVTQGTGAYGSALDYLRNVVRHLDEFGIDDCPLHRVLRLAEAKAASAGGGPVA